MNTDIGWLSATETARAFAERRLSPVEVMQALLSRIEALQPKLAAVIRLDAGPALEAARIAEREIAAGRSRGPLHGIAVGIKDIIDVVGLPTTCHSRILLGNVARADAEVVARLRQAGAIVIGKLATHEFAIGGPSHDLPFPAARNPWNPEHHPGGSSSGSGAGVAAGLFPLALGTDTGGSVRNPASCCGIVGLKPTYGLVSRRGVFPLAYTLDHVGPMTRSVADNAALLQAIAGFDPADPGSAPARPGDFAREIGLGARGLRVGFVRHFHEEDMPAHPEVATALEEAARVLAAEGAEIRAVRLPPLSRLAAANRVILNAEAWSVHARWLRERPGDYGKLTRRRLLAGAFIQAGDYVAAQRHRAEMMAAVEEAFREVDVLLCASSMDPPSRIDDEAETLRTYPRQARAPFNLTGHPALAMMAGLSKDGLPLSLQFVGPWFNEARVYRIAAAYERAAGWQSRRPPV